MNTTTESVLAATHYGVALARSRDRHVRRCLDRDTLDCAAGWGLAKAIRDHDPAKGHFDAFLKVCVWNAVRVEGASARRFPSPFDGPRVPHAILDNRGESNHERAQRIAALVPRLPRPDREILTAHFGLGKHRAKSLNRMAREGRKGYRLVRKRLDRALGRLRALADS